MTPFLTLTRRELAGYFLNLRGYVILAGVQLFLGASLLLATHQAEGMAMGMTMVEAFPRSQFFWLVLLLAAPIITMRTFAHEKSTGTYETLLTAPVRDRDVVLAKFTGAYTFYLAAFAPMVVYPYLLHRYSHQPVPLDFALVASLGLGVALIGAFFIALGCLASSLSRSQIVSAVVAFGAGSLHLILSFLSGKPPAEAAWWHAVYQHISAIDHLRDFSQGILDTRHMVFYLSLTMVCLFLTGRSVESRRWR